MLTATLVWIIIKNTVFEIPVSFVSVDIAKYALSAHVFAPVYMCAHICALLFTSFLFLLVVHLSFTLRLRI